MLKIDSYQTATDVFDRATDFLARSVERGGIYGLAGSAWAFSLAAAARGGARPIVVALPDGDSAATLASDTRFYLGREDRSVTPLSDPVLHIPSSDTLPYSSGGFETEVTANHSARLFRLAEFGAPRIITVGLDAFTRRVIPRDALLRNSFTLERGMRIDRDELLRMLTEAGYFRSPLVEDAGEFSVRGFVVDIYPPLYPYPVRVEQMGDDIESLRFFDPTNQRSKDETSSVSISPVHMMIPDEEARERGLERIMKRCESLGVEKRVRKRLMDDLRNGVRFPGQEMYLPFFYEKREFLFDYLPHDCSIVLPDEDALGRAFEDLDEEIFRGWEAAVSDGIPAPDPQDLYLTRDEFNRRVADFRTIVMSQLEIEDPKRTGIRVNCSDNADIRMNLVRARGYDAGLGGLVETLQRLRDDGCEVMLVSHANQQAQRLLKLLEPYELNLDFRGEGFDPSHLITDPTPGIRLYVGDLSAGFRMESARRIIITEEEIFGSKVRSPKRRRARGSLISSLTDLAEGEAVVHEDYGIGVFRGLTKKEFDGCASEIMVIEYAGGDLLYHPVERLQYIQKYVSGSDSAPRIDRLGGKGWAKTKAKVKKSIREMAKDLLEIYARRHEARRRPYAPPDETFTAFEASFDFEETPDQAQAIEDIMNSMDTDRPMDHLVCGDVGYGKTEVALRAAFRATMDGKQVAVLVPTTVLAQQHFDTIKRRFAGYPIEIDVISRFRKSADQKTVLKRLAEGKIDIVVGTHRLLQKDVEFQSLGLIVVDEEHRFGVTHKERIKKYKSRVDVLTLTATPIPRTLNMALTGIRDLSVIETPPTNRKSIRTHVMRQSDEVVRDAILREVRRGGQVFYLHNRVKTIYKRAAALKNLVPEASFGVAHAQMKDRELEQVMLDFVTGKVNALVCTSIIESGLDIPRANTIIIERADAFGLADLYQLRGRVGRSHMRAYAYLLTPPETLMTPDAVKRLAVIQEHSTLGQGFRIAMRDMEIRGAGNILGTSQSGHVVQVGYEMYLELLEQAVQEIKGEEPERKIDPEMGLKVEALLPDDYVPDPQQRMNLYKRLSRAEDNEEIDEIEAEILDLYGQPPEQARNLLSVMRIRLSMKELRILRLDYNGADLVLTFDAETPVDGATLVGWAHEDPRRVRLLPGDRLMYKIGDKNPADRVAEVFGLLDRLKGSPRHRTPQVVRRPARV